MKPSTRLLMIVLGLLFGFTAFMLIESIRNTPDTGLYSKENVERVRRNEPKSYVPAPTIEEEEEPIALDLAEITCLQKNIYFESRNQGLEGQLATVWVTLNRVKSRHYPNTICDVVKQAVLDANGNPVLHKCKFSWYCDGKSDKPSSNPVEQEAWTLAGNIAALMYRHCIAGDNSRPCPPDPTGGALYYHTDKVSPSWMSVYEETTRIGNHIYYTRNG